MATKILIVDDERGLADTLCDILCRAGYDCRAEYSGSEALAHLEQSQPALVISDVMMPGLNGVDLAKKIRGRFPECRVLLFSGNAATHDLLLIARAEGYNFQVLAKPLPPRKLLAIVADTLAQPQVDAFVW